MPAVDDGGRAGRREAVGVDPVALGPELLVEDVDRGLLLRGVGLGPVGENGNQVLRHRIISCRLWPPLGPPLPLPRTALPGSDTSAEISSRSLVTPGGV